jgi:hypothetical protein
MFYKAGAGIMLTPEIINNKFISNYGEPNYDQIMANYLCHQICFYITIEQIRTSIEVYKYEFGQITCLKDFSL